MPVVVTGIFAAFKAFAGTKVGAFIINKVLIPAGISIGVHYAIRALTRRDEPERDFRTTLLSEITPARYVIGRARTGGVLVFADVVNDGRTIQLGIALSEGPCEKIETLWIDGEEVPLTGTTLLQPSRGGKYPSESVKIYPYLKADGTEGAQIRNDVEDRFDGVTDPYGTPIEGGPIDNEDYPTDPSANPESYYEFHGEAGPGTVVVRDGDGNITNYIDHSRPTTPWGPNHRGVGVSWCVVELTQNQYDRDRPEDRLFDRVPNLEFLVQGMKLTWPGQTDATWTENAAAIRHWLLRNRRGVPADKFNVASFNAAFALCEQDVTLTLPASHANQGLENTHKRYALNGIFDAGEDLSQIEAQMDAAWAGHIVEHGGEIFMRPGVERTPTQSVGLSDIVASSTFSPWLPIQERINAIRVTIPQAQNVEYTDNSLPELVDMQARDRDGEYRPQELSFRFVANPLAAGRLQAILLRRLRQSATMQVTLKPGDSFERYNLIPTDVINVTDTDFGIANKRFVITRKGVYVDGSVVLDLMEDDPDIYDDTLVLPDLRPRVIRLGTTRDTLVAVAGHALDEIASIAKDGSTIVQLVASWNPARVARTIVEWRELGLADWQRTESTGTSLVLANVAAGETYEARFAHVNNGGKQGPWSATISDTIDGDLSPPSNPTGTMAVALPQGFRLAVTQPTLEADYARTQVFVLKLGTDYQATDKANDGAAIRAMIGATAASFGTTVDGIYVTANDDRISAMTEHAVLARNVDLSGNLSSVSNPVYFTPLAALESATGATHIVTSVPADDFGNDGDLAFRTNGQVYLKRNGAWELQFDISASDGTITYAVTRSASLAATSDLIHLLGTNGLPMPSLGNLGDLAIHVGPATEDGTGRMFEKLSGGWTEVTDLTGNEGPTGPRGLSIHSGTGAPPNSLGEIGDTYLADDGFLWVKSASNIWQRSNTNLTGEQGIQGQRGLQGPQGARGEQGPRGIQGVRGDQGPQGEDGERGPRGLQGVQGNQGAAGQDGERGDQVWRFYTNAPPEYPPARLVPIGVGLANNSRWNTVGRDYVLYLNPTEVPDNEDPEGERHLNFTSERHYALLETDVLTVALGLVLGLDEHTNVSLQARPLAAPEIEQFIPIRALSAALTAGESVDFGPDDITTPVDIRRTINASFTVRGDIPASSLRIETPQALTLRTTGERVSTAILPVWNTMEITPSNGDGTASQNTTNSIWIGPFDVDQERFNPSLLVSSNPAYLSRFWVGNPRVGNNQCNLQFDSSPTSRGGMGAGTSISNLNNLARRWVVWRIVPHDTSVAPFAFRGIDDTLEPYTFTPIEIVEGNQQAFYDGMGQTQNKDVTFMYRALHNAGDLDFGLDTARFEVSDNLGSASIEDPSLMLLDATHTFSAAVPTVANADPFTSNLLENNLLSWFACRINHQDQAGSIDNPNRLQYNHAVGATTTTTTREPIHENYQDILGEVDLVLGVDPPRPPREGDAGTGLTVTTVPERMYLGRLSLFKRQNTLLMQFFVLPNQSNYFARSPLARWLRQDLQNDMIFRLAFDEGFNMYFRLPLNYGVGSRDAVYNVRLQDMQAVSILDRFGRAVTFGDLIDRIRPVQNQGLWFMYRQVRTLDESSLVRPMPMMPPT